MLPELLKNRRILCVDDEPEMLETYRQVLGKTEDVFAGILADADGAGTDGPFSGHDDFDVVVVESGEEAIRVVEENLSQGRTFAAGFFDMRMPGGIDGYETIRRVRKIDPNILCAVVTAYTDRSVEQISKLFLADHQDELLYFNKPFRSMELRQTAVNMVCNWNRKRKVEEQLRVIEKHRRGLQFIFDAVSCLTDIPPQPLQSILSGILFQGLAMVDGENGYIAIYDGNGQLLIRAALGRYEHQEFSKVALDEKVREQAFGRKRAVIQNKTCVVPLIYNGRDIGIICLDVDDIIDASVEEELLNTFRTHMAPIIMNSIFYDDMLKKDLQVVTDHLTGLYNRRFLVERLREEMCRCCRDDQQIGVMMIDIDDFKAINDTYGRDTGDYVLRTMGGLIKDKVRCYDSAGRISENSEDGSPFAIRYGGEEFCIVSSCTDRAGAARVAERLRQTVEEYEFRFRNVSFALTVSIGLCVRSVTQDDMLEASFVDAIMHRADKALYHAKMSGKNRVAFFEENTALVGS